LSTTPVCEPPNREAPGFGAADVAVADVAETPVEALAFVAGLPKLKTLLEDAAVAAEVAPKGPPSPENKSLLGAASAVVVVVEGASEDVEPSDGKLNGDFEFDG